MKSVSMAIKENLNGVSFTIPACKETLKMTDGITIGDQLDNISNMVQLAKSKDMLTRGYIDHFMGSALTDKISSKDLNSIASALNDMGVDEIILQDSVAAGKMDSLLEKIQDLKVPIKKIGIHFYDSKYRGLELTITALSQGISNITTSIGGIGRSPYYETPLGNVVFSDLLFVLECLGIDHGIKWKKVLRTEEKVCDWLERENLSDVVKLDFEEDLSQYKGKVQSTLGK